MSKRKVNAKPEHEQGKLSSAPRTQLSWLSDASSPAVRALAVLDADEAALPCARAILNPSGKSVEVGAMRLYSDSGEAAAPVLQRIAWLLNGASANDVEGLGAEPVILSGGGGRLDVPALDVSIRVRGGARGESRQLLAEIAELWRTAPTAASTVCGPAAGDDALRLHRFHFGVEGSQLRLGHPTLKLSVTVKGDRAVAKAAAYRLALTWNVCEGLPREAIEAGVLLDATADELVQAFEAGLDCTALIARMAEYLRQRDRLIDRTGGRLSDCARCRRDGDD